MFGRRTGLRRPALAGYLLALGSVVLFTFEAALAKVIGPEINAAQVPALRCVLQLAFLGFLIKGRFRAVMRTDNIGGHVWRGLFSAFGALLYFYVFAHMPFGAATVIFFTSVLFTSALAGPILAERVGWRRWGATIIGFGGVLLVVRPEAIAFDFVLLLAFLLALDAAAINIATKGLTRTEGTLSIMLWISTISALTLVPLSLAAWTWPTPRVAGLMVAIALLGMVGQYLSISAYRHADASSLAPVLYLRIVIAGFLGWWIFGEVVDPLSATGALVITVTAIYITVEESRSRRSIARRE